PGPHPIRVIARQTSSGLEEVAGPTSGDPGPMREGEDDPDVQGRARGRVPPWLRRAIVFLLLGAAALFIAVWLVGRLRSLITMLLVSLFLAFAMEPATNYLAARGWRRGLATATVFAVTRRA